MYIVYYKADDHWNIQLMVGPFFNIPGSYSCPCNESMWLIPGTWRE